MFGELIEKVTVMVQSLTTRAEAQARVRARFQVAGSLFAGMVAQATPQELGVEQNVKTMVAAALASAKLLEAEVYEDASDELKDFQD